MEKDKGITLVALVVTIVVLIILAGISINLVLGENGILTKAQEAKEKSEQAAQNEQVMMNELVTKINEINSGNNGEDNSPVFEYETRPTIPEGSIIIESDLEKGMTIKDKNNNEWVWIEVPRTRVFGLPMSNIDYAKIEADLKAYTVDYRMEGWTDTWYDGCGIATEVEYNNLKNRMLSSIYENGGFWIGRYEAGTDISRMNITLTTPLIQQDKYPYYFVTISQGQSLATQLSPDNNYTSNLMFGVQWDLVLKYIETKRAKTQAELKLDSTDWGNYNNTTFDITKGKYSTDDGETFTDVKGIYTKPINTVVLLTTGASERNKVLNIYDLAGNEFEWTLEKSANPDGPCSYRGGFCRNNGFDFSVFCRGYFNTRNISNGISFRPTLYK